MTNRLAFETSPYLKQHAHNPVDWFPWGDEALQKAKAQNKIIFLSIGYSACHWCHVMERESFEDRETADILKADFISIKVDREERPDIDHIYMNAVQVLTQRGGWPLTVFLTPDLQPFYGGTYFPLHDKHGLPSFKRVLKGIVGAWKLRREEVVQTAGQLVEAVKNIYHHDHTSSDLPELNWVDEGALSVLKRIDVDYGGFGSAPKFFHTFELRLLLRHWKRTGNEDSLKAVAFSLEKIAAGGIQDHLGGGFHRYSTDDRWLVPHFEKMLYDNALLSTTFIEAYQATGNARFLETAQSTLNYLLRDMKSPEGAFYCAEDADSEGVEGKFYVWSKKEIQETLGDAALSELFCKAYGVTDSGNWEGSNIPWREVSNEMDEIELSAAKRKLWAKREERVHPAKDTKIIASWNAWTVEALCRAYRITETASYLEAAQGAGKFVLEKMWNGKTLAHVFQEAGKAANGFLEDYAGWVQAFLILFETDADPKWLNAAEQIASVMVEEFYDSEKPGFFFTPKSQTALIARPKEIYDGATPSPNGMALMALLHLSKLTMQTPWVLKVESVLKNLGPWLRQMPSSMGQTLLALEWFTTGGQELVLVPGTADEDYREAVRGLCRKFLPSTVFVTAEMGKVPALSFWLEGKKSMDGEVTLYRCHGQTCQPPIVGVHSILGL